LIARVTPLSPFEQREILLGYFNGILNGMETPMIVQLKAHLLKTCPRCPVQDTMIEVLDGHMALREIDPEE
jgi:hypothetical protein